MTIWMLWCALVGVQAQDADTAAADTAVELVDEQELLQDAERLRDQRFEVLAATKRANERRAADATRARALKDQTAKALAVVALLLLWLLTRKQNERQRRVPQRHAPRTPEELAHLLFQAILEADLDTYRGLYPTGGEAAQLLGQGAAERYLGRRTWKKLEDALVELAIRVPPGATLEGAAIEDGALLLVVRFSGQVERVLAGTVRQVGPIWRLYEPPSEAEREPPSFSTGS